MIFVRKRLLCRSFDRLVRAIGVEEEQSRFVFEVFRNARRSTKRFDRMFILVGNGQDGDGGRVAILARKQMDGKLIEIPSSVLNGKPVVLASDPEIGEQLVSRRLVSAVHAMDKDILTCVLAHEISALEMKSLA